jgi:hypothetical protein
LLVILSGAKNPRIFAFAFAFAFALAFAFAFAVAVEIERGFSPASKPAAKRPTALPKAGAKPEGRSD